jgi:hypothetical protein
MSLSDLEKVARLRDVIRRIVQSEIATQRPRGRDAYVEVLDFDANVVMVVYADEPGSDPVAVRMPAAFVPQQGDLVRVEGVQGGRYIAAVLTGDAHIRGEIIVDRLITSADVPTEGAIEIDTDDRANTILFRSPVGAGNPLELNPAYIETEYDDTLDIAALTIRARESAVGVQMWEDGVDSFVEWWCASLLNLQTYDVSMSFFGNDINVTSTTGTGKLFVDDVGTNLCHRRVYNPGTPTAVPGTGAWVTPVVGSSAENIGHGGGSISSMVGFDGGVSKFVLYEPGVWDVEFRGNWGATAGPTFPTYFAGLGFQVDGVDEDATGNNSHGGPYGSQDQAFRVGGIRSTGTTTVLPRVAQLSGATHNFQMQRLVFTYKGR